MALKDYCKTAPHSNPETCPQVDHNWNKVADMHDVMCCLLSKTIALPLLQEDYIGTELTQMGTDTVVNLPSWDLTDATNADFLVFWNGQKRGTIGSGQEGANWAYTDGTIVFDSLLDADCVVCVIYQPKTTLLDLLDCDVVQTSC